MLPLAGARIPDSPEALAAALHAGLTAQGLPPREVAARGAWPSLDLLRIDLTGAQIPRTRPQSPAGEPCGTGCTAARFELIATPAHLESAPVHVSLLAVAAEFDFTAAENDTSLLLIRRAAQGDVTLEVSTADLERLVQTHAANAAREHGADIKSVRIRFDARGPRALSVTAEVTAKVFIATATLTLSGDLDLDDQLNARLSNLRFAGDGMVASLAGGFIRPQLAALEGRTFPLLSFALGEIRLRDVQVQVGDTLRLAAQFGS
jgi:hypothetical protein